MRKRLKKKIAQRSSPSVLAIMTKTGKLRYFNIFRDYGPRHRRVLTRWARWYDATDRHLGETWIGDVRVSTVFLGVNYGFMGVPKWFETMVFHPDGQPGLCLRYSTAKQARKGHLEVVRSMENAFAEE